MFINRCLFLIVITLAISSCAKERENELNIAVSANMQFAMDSISKNFSKKTGIKIKTILGSSGTLSAQINEGANFDVFVSADMIYPENLYRSKLTLSKPQVYATGSLVLWSASEHIKPSIEVLTFDEIKHIAIPNPNTAPYGVAVREVLNHYSIYDQIEAKLVYGESVAQTNLFISTKSAEIGFTSLSTVLSQKRIKKNRWLNIDRNIHASLEQGICILKNHKSSLNKIQAFYEFIFSKECKDILDKFGYLVAL